MSPINDADLDRLADYTAGVLDPEDQRRVDELIRTDPAWRQAHQALAGAQPRVDAALAGLGPATMPQDVADRLDSALAGETGPADRGTAKVIDISRRRRWTRLAAGTTAAAAAVAAIFAGVIALSNSGGYNAATSNGAPQPKSPALALGQPSVLHSGKDYTPRTLGGGGASTSTDSQTAPRPDAQNAAGDNLSRLNDQAALGQCLAAIVAVHGGTPSVVDYARFDGEPALVVTLVGTAGHRIVVVGPQCGIGGPAEIYTTMQ